MEVFNFPKMRREIATQPHKAQTATYNINPRRNMPRQILIKLTKIKHKEQILKTTWEKQQITYKGIPVRLKAKLCTTEGNGWIYLKR